MKEFLFILIVVVILAGFTIYRYRKQILVAVEFWKKIQAIRERHDDARPNISSGPPKQILFHCPGCGSWVNEKTAVRFGKSKYYCSTKCLNESIAS